MVVHKSNQERRKIKEGKVREDSNYDKIVYLNKIQDTYQSYQIQLKRLVEKEIKKGKSVVEAVNFVIDNEVVLKLLPKLQDEEIRRGIKNIIRNEFYIKQNEENDGGEER